MPARMGGTAAGSRAGEGPLLLPQPYESDKLRSTTGECDAVPNMSAKASELNDPADLIARIMYRNNRMKTKLVEKDDPVAFVSLMTGFNRTDLRRLADVLGIPKTELP